MRLLPVIIAFLCGAPFGAFCLYVMQKLAKRRYLAIAQRVAKMRVGETLDQAETGELLEELSRRDLSSEKGKS